MAAETTAALRFFAGSGGAGEGHRRIAVQPPQQALQGGIGCLVHCRVILRPARQSGDRLQDARLTEAA